LIQGGAGTPRPLVAAALLATLAACGQSTYHADRLAWVDRLADLELEMSMQMLRMETMREGVERDPELVRLCNPEESREAFASVNANLRELHLRLPAGVDVQQSRGLLREVEKNWDTLARRQKSIWRESEGLPDLDLRERCIRADAVASSRLAIERDANLLMKLALRGDRPAGGDPTGER
jgi:hypothetical protein